MAKLDQSEPNTEKPLYYERYDFPFVRCSPKNGYPEIGWEVPNGANTGLMNELGDKISLLKEEKEQFFEEFEALKDIYQMNRVEAFFIERDDGTFALSLLDEQGQNALWMYVYSGIDDHKGTDLQNYLNKENKIHIHNLDSPRQALFFIESLAKYYKYLGIEFPYIQTKKIGEKSSDMHKGTENVLSFSFTIPYEEKDYTTIQNIFKSTSYLWDIDVEEIFVSEEGLFIKNECYGKFLANEEEELFFQLDQIQDMNKALYIFSAFSRLLEIKMYDEIR